MNPDRVPASVVNWLAQNSYGQVAERRPVGGGCINNGARLITTTGYLFFIKTNSHVPEDMFAREAEGLLALMMPDSPRVPQTYCFGEDFILLEDLNPAPRRSNYWQEFGQKLARLHNHTSDRFGFTNDNYIGSTPQVNAWTVDGYEFFGQQRLLYQARLALRQGYLDSKQVKQVEQVITRLPELVPLQPASLIHGDLWSGNALTDQTGEPALIDPAAYYGWAEAELAMTALFGSFPDAFYRAYVETRPLEPAFRERFPLYNLYHLLNHLNLFGHGYLGEVLSVLSRFS